MSTPRMHPFSPFTSQTDRSFYTLPPVTLRNTQNPQSMPYMSGSAHPFATQLSRAHRPKPTSCFTTLPDLGRPKSRINSLLSPQISGRSCAHFHRPPLHFVHRSKLRSLLRTALEGTSEVRPSSPATSHRQAPTLATTAAVQSNYRCQAAQTRAHLTSPLPCAAQEHTAGRSHHLQSSSYKAFETKSDLQNAVRNPNANIAIYGTIDKWDVSKITDMSVRRSV